MEKVERDGKVAVLVSHGFGAGWSTWNSEHAAAFCMDARLVQPVLDGDRDRAAKVAVELFPDAYTGGADDLRVEWLPKGTIFEIDEYDGSETLHIIGSRDYLVA
jgi:hypothetical protein